MLNKSPSENTNPQHLDDILGRRIQAVRRKPRPIPYSSSGSSTESEDVETAVKKEKATPKLDNSKDERNAGNGSTFVGKRRSTPSPELVKSPSEAIGTRLSSRPRRAARHNDQLGTNPKTLQIRIPRLPEDQLSPVKVENSDNSNSIAGSSSPVQDESPTSFVNREVTVKHKDSVKISMDKAKQKSELRSVSSGVAARKKLEAARRKVLASSSKKSGKVQFHTKAKANQRKQKIFRHSAKPTQVKIKMNFVAKNPTSSSSFNSPSVRVRKELEFVMKEQEAAIETSRRNLEFLASESYTIKRQDLRFRKKQHHSSRPHLLQSPQTLQAVVDESSGDESSNYQRPLRKAAAAALEAVTQVSKKADGDFDPLKYWGKPSLSRQPSTKIKGRRSIIKRAMIQRGIAHFPEEPIKHSCSFDFKYGIYFQKGDVVSTYRNESVNLAQILHVIRKAENVTLAEVIFLTPIVTIDNDDDFQPILYTVDAQQPHELVVLDNCKWIMHLPPDYYCEHEVFSTESVKTTRLNFTTHLSSKSLCRYETKDLQNSKEPSEVAVNTDSDVTSTESTSGFTSVSSESVETSMASSPGSPNSSFPMEPKEVDEAGITPEKCASESNAFKAQGEM